MTHSTADNTEIQAVTADGTDIQEITADGTLVWQAVEIIDDFEDGDASGWDVSGGGTRSIVSGLDGTSFAWEHSGFTEAYLSGSNAVDRGPQPGDVFEIWVQIDSDNGGSVINRIEFSSDGAGDGDKYRIEYERNTSDTELSIEKISGGTQDLLDTDENFVPSLGQTYRLVVGWNDGDTDVTGQMLFPDGSNASTQVSISDDSSAAGSEFTQDGIYVQTNDNNTQIVDEAKITGP